MSCDKHKDTAHCAGCDAEKLAKLLGYVEELMPAARQAVKMMANPLARFVRRG